MHEIRLRGPWLRQDDASSDWVRVSVPDDAMGASEISVSVCRYRRWFHCPTGIDAQTRVLLHLGRCRRSVESLSLNGQRISISPGCDDVDVTDQLRPRNDVIITVNVGTDRGARLGDDVAIRIVPHPPS